MQMGPQRGGGRVDGGYSYTGRAKAWGGTSSGRAALSEQQQQGRPHRLRSSPAAALLLLLRLLLRRLLPPPPPSPPQLVRRSEWRCGVTSRRPRPRAPHGPTPCGAPDKMGALVCQQRFGRTPPITPSPTSRVRSPPSFYVPRTVSIIIGPPGAAQINLHRKGWVLQKDSPNLGRQNLRKERTVTPA